MKYWLHRISHWERVSYPLLKEGYLSYGFSLFSTKEFLEEATQANWDYFEKSFQDEWKWGPKPRSRHSLWRFIADMDKGDWVIVPSWGTFSIYEILEPMAKIIQDIEFSDIFTDWNGNRITVNEDGLLCLPEENNQLIDLGFVRKVKLIAKDLPRNKFADSALTSRMKIRQANADITDLEESIKKAYTAYKEDKPIDIKASLMDGSKGIWLDIIRKELNSTKFERMVEWYFDSIGASEVTIPSKNSKNKEGDVDVVAIFEKIRTIINVQVKYHKGKTSDDAIKQIIEYADSQEGMDDGYLRQYWIVSSADSFSDDSIKKAKEKNVLLVDGSQFIQMMIENGVNNLDKFCNHQ